MLRRNRMLRYALMPTCSSYELAVVVFWLPERVMSTFADFPSFKMCIKETIFSAHTHIHKNTKLHSIHMQNSHSRDTQQT